MEAKSLRFGIVLFKSIIDWTLRYGCFLPLYISCLTFWINFMSDWARELGRLLLCALSKSISPWNGIKSSKLYLYLFSGKYFIHKLCLRNVCERRTQFGAIGRKVNFYHSNYINIIQALPFIMISSLELRLWIDTLRKSCEYFRVIRFVGKMNSLLSSSWSDINTNISVVGSVRMSSTQWMQKSFSIHLELI